MNEDILNNLNYFSEVTQRTLSAFHTFGSDASLIDEINSIKRFITNAKVKKLVKVKRIENEKFIRYFSDNSSDIVDLEDLSKPAYYENKYDFSVIEKALSQDINPISSLKLSNSIEHIKNKKIEKPSEIIFFM